MRRINLRVPEAQFTDWDNKRHDEKTTFQALGMALFESWYDGKKAVREQAQSPSLDRIKIRASLQEAVELISSALSHLEHDQGRKVVASHHAGSAREAGDPVRGSGSNTGRVRKKEAL